MTERVCICCGSDKYYAKKLCRNCYHRYMRTGFETPEEFISNELDRKDELSKRDFIKAISKIIKFNRTDLANAIGVSSQYVSNWFVHGQCYIPEKYIDIVYDWLINEARDAMIVLTDIVA